MDKTKKKEKTPSFIVEFSLHVEKFQFDRLEKGFEVSRKIFNACLGELQRRFHLMIQSKEYQCIMKQIRSTYRAEEKQKHLNKKMGTKNEVFLDEARKPLWKVKNNLHRQFGLEEYSMHDYVKEMCGRNGKFPSIPSDVGQKIASRAWASMEKFLYGNGKGLHFKKYGQLETLEGKSNLSGIKYREGFLIWNDLKIPVMIKKQDLYAQMALGMNRIKYCRVKRRYIRGQVRYFVQFVFEGTPPKKIDPKTGLFKHQINNKEQGLDIGTQTVAACTEDRVCIEELASHIDLLERKKRILLRRLDRQRRANNPHKYDEDGQIKKGNRDPWFQSRNYIKTLMQWKELYRKQVAIRKQDHYNLIRELMANGCNIKIESMNFKSLQRRAKETKKDEKTGKFKKKKRFGKSIANKAPASFVTLLKQKLKQEGFTLQEIATHAVKASQYNHVTGDYEKSELKDRWKEFVHEGETKRIQRDLYSAFLIWNVKEDLVSIHRERCLERFSNFVHHHDREIQRVRQNPTRALKNIGIR